ncbi:MAG: UbiA family prenyltransferase [Syntrophales bacterium]
MNKVKIYLWTLPRWAFLPFFGVCTLLGVVLAKGSLGTLNTWLAFITTMFLMAGGHSFNTLLDTIWTHLDDPGHEHSVEKSYAAGSVVISEGLASPKEVLINAICWYAAALIPGIILAIRVTPLVLIPIFFGMCVTFAYSPSKFTWLHEVCLASGVVAAAVIGSLSTGTGEWIRPILITIPLCLIFSFAGLGLDEYPDSEANLKQGVKSLAYQVWKQGFDHALYIMLWVFLAYMVQMFFIVIGWLKPLTGLTLIALPFAIADSVFLKKEITFKKAALVMVVIAMAYPLLLLLGELLGKWAK